jgi:hypothetical protein
MKYDAKTMTMPMLTMEFLRLVVNQLKGRKFEHSPMLNLPPERIMAVANATDVLKKLPDMTREFAEKIKPEWIRCHELPELGNIVQGYQYTSRDLESGLSIRCLRIFDPLYGEMVYRFDSCFS